MVDIFINDDDFGEFFKNLGELPDNFDTRSVVTQLSQFISARIKIRTDSGVDADLLPFTAYAVSTSRDRASRGRVTNKVTLQDTGQMMAALGARTVSDNEAVVGFFDAIQQRKAIIQQLGLGNVPTRAFFGISDKDTVTTAGINKIMGAEMDRALDEL